jgi:hypothetical protein|tara:strand:+ start:705 stop:1172 length:468 start_codon:yes stop_codon:yes gene_type:complete
MRIYEVRDARGNTVHFARAFDQAKSVVKLHDSSARKVSSNNERTEFSSCWIIEAIDIKPDKDGIITKLNSLLLDQEPQTKKPDSYEPHIINFPGDEEEVEEVEVPAPVENKTPVGISPAIEFTGNGKGTCLHCNKTVGYVGGFPRVNPPEEIRDK